MGLAVEAALVGRCGPPAAPFFGDAMAHEQGLEKAELMSTGAARRTGQLISELDSSRERNKWYQVAGSGLRCVKGASGAAPGGAGTPQLGTWEPARKTQTS